MEKYGVEQVTYEVLLPMKGTTELDVKGTGLSLEEANKLREEIPGSQIRPMR